MKFYKVVFSVEDSLNKHKRFVFANDEKDLENIIRKTYNEIYNFTFWEIEEIEIKRGIIWDLVNFD